MSFLFIFLYIIGLYVKINKNFILPLFILGNILLYFFPFSIFHYSNFEFYLTLPFLVFAYLGKENNSKLQTILPFLPLGFYPVTTNVLFLYITYALIDEVHEKEGAKKISILFPLFVFIFYVLKNKNFENSNLIYFAIIMSCFCLGIVFKASKYLRTILILAIAFYGSFIITLENIWAIVWIVTLLIILILKTYYFEKLYNLLNRYLFFEINIHRLKLFFRKKTLQNITYYKEKTEINVFYNFIIILIVGSLLLINNVNVILLLSPIIYGYILISSNSADKKNIFSSYLILVFVYLTVEVDNFRLLASFLVFYSLLKIILEDRKMSIITFSALMYFIFELGIRLNVKNELGFYIENSYLILIFLAIILKKKMEPILYLIPLLGSSLMNLIMSISFLLFKRITNDSKSTTFNSMSIITGILLSCILYLILLIEQETNNKFTMLALLLINYKIIDVRFNREVLC